MFLFTVSVLLYMLFYQSLKDVVHLAWGQRYSAYMHGQCVCLCMSAITYGKHYIAVVFVCFHIVILLAIAVIYIFYNAAKLPKDDALDKF